MSVVPRTIKNGQVKINGRIYRPNEKWRPYDGRLDGMRYGFGVYDGRPEFVSLWGQWDDAAPWPGPDCVDGIFVWAWWDAVSTPLPAPKGETNG